MLAEQGASAVIAGNGRKWNESRAGLQNGVLPFLVISGPRLSFRRGLESRKSGAALIHMDGAGSGFGNWVFGI